MTEIIDLTSTTTVTANSTILVSNGTNTTTVTAAVLKTYLES